MLRRLSFLVLLLTGTLPPCAALEWQTRTLEFTTAPFQAAQEAVFRFTNTSDRPVRVLAVESNCDCLEARADQAIYPPRSRGTIRTTFTIGTRLGLYERWIKVVTDENHEPVRLLLRIEVPELVVLAPHSVAWRINEAPDEKSVELAVIPGLRIEFTGVQSSNGAFAARLETIEAGRRYRVHLKPPGTAQPANAAFRLQGRASSGQDVMVSAYGNVR
ncbi:MAG: DUF1573 domain-containing protein [Opitutae bacterium]|nr:DUF1573 domain-containing protein [Opitutae bacterium]